MSNPIKTLYNEFREFDSTEKSIVALVALIALAVSTGIWLICHLYFTLDG